MGAHLDRVLLAQSHVQGFHRWEHGREEYVNPHERMLRDLAGGAPGMGMGRLNNSDFPMAMDDLQVQLRPPEEEAAKSEIAAAHKAFQAGDYMGAHYHLGKARQVATSSDYNAGYLRRVLTEAQAHMSLREQAGGPTEQEASGEYPPKPAKTTADMVSGNVAHRNVGPGGIIRRNDDPDVLNLPVQVDLAEPVVRFLERRQARRELKAAKKQPKVPKLRSLV